MIEIRAMIVSNRINILEFSIMTNKKQVNLDRHLLQCVALFELGNCQDTKLIEKYSGNGKAIRSVLVRMENTISKLSLAQCNDADFDISLLDRSIEVAKQKFGDMFPDLSNDLYINTDPRGYALKIDDKAMQSGKYDVCKLDRDWGGYGLLSPQI
jgi:hypothetical protein